MYFVEAMLKLQGGTLLPHIAAYVESSTSASATALEYDHGVNPKDTDTGMKVGLVERMGCVCKLVLSLG